MLTSIFGTIPAVLTSSFGTIEAIAARTDLVSTIHLDIVSSEDPNIASVEEEAVAAKKAEERPVIARKAWEELVTARTDIASSRKNVGVFSHNEGKYDWRMEAS